MRISLPLVAACGCLLQGGAVFAAERTGEERRRGDGRALRARTRLPRQGTVFVVEDEAFDGIRVKVLRNHLTGERVEILPDLGGRIDSLVLLPPPPTTLPLSAPSPTAILENTGRNATALNDARTNGYWAGAFLAPWANRVANATYTWEGRTLHLPPNELPKRRSALHGLLSRRAMAVEQEGVDADGAHLVLSYQFVGSDPGYPFQLKVTINYLLSLGGLTVKAQASNTASSGSLPFAFGWHPYFRVLSGGVGDASVLLEPTAKWGHLELSPGAPRAGDLIPTGIIDQNVARLTGGRPLGVTSSGLPTYLDDCYVCVWGLKDGVLRTRLYAKGGPAAAPAIVLWQESGTFPFLQVHTGAWESRHSASVAIEPQSAPANAFNSGQGLVTLEAGEGWEGSFGVYLE